MYPIVTVYTDTPCLVWSKLIRDPRYPTNNMIAVTATTQSNVIPTKGSLQKKKPKKSLEFSKLSGPPPPSPPPKVWKLSKILGFFQVAQ